MKELVSNKEMGEVDDSPGHAGGATEEREDDEPREEENQNVARPNPWVREPLRVPIQIRRRNRPYVHPSRLLLLMMMMN